MALTSNFKTPELLPWQAKMGIYVSEIMKEVLKSYEIVTEKEVYLDGLKSQLKQLKQDISDAVIEEINLRKDGKTITAHFLAMKEERAAGVVRLGRTIKRWQKKVDDAQDRMRRLNLLWKQAYEHYNLQMETYKSDEQRREEKRYMDEKRIIDEQMRKIAYDEKMMKEKAAKIKARLKKKKDKKKKMEKEQAAMNKKAYATMIEKSFDTQAKLLKEFDKTDVVKNPPKRRELNLSAIGADMGETPREGDKKAKANSSKEANAMKSAAKGMGLS